METGPDGRSGGAIDHSLRLSELVRAGGDAVLVGQGDPRVTGVAHDSRSVRPGDLFAALPGARRHGAACAAEAVSAGAVAVLTDAAGARLLDGAGVRVPRLIVEDPAVVLGPVAAAVHGDPGAGLSLIGVTGTNGKTTTTHLLDAALRALGRTTGLIGTVQTRVGPRARPSRMTTPDAPDLQALLAAMRDEGVDVVSMECSSHALDQHRLGGLVFDVVAFTNLSREHLDYHGSMEDYYAAKARLFAPERARRGIVVVDDEWGRRLAAEARIPVVTLAGGPGQLPAGVSGARMSGDGSSAVGSPAAGTSTAEASTQAGSVDAAMWRVSGTAGSEDFVLSGPDGELRLRTPLPGEHNRVNTAVAALVLLQLGATPDQVVAALGAPVEVPGRMQLLDLGPGAPTAVVDFAHTPDAMAKSAALRRRHGGRLVITVSAGGDRDRGKREPIGYAAAMSGADVLVVTDDHPRTEDPAVIRAAVLRGVRAAGQELQTGGRRPPEVIEVGEGRRRALEVALGAAGPGGMVGFFGLGPDRHQHIGPPGTLVPFVETEEIRAAWTRVSRAGDPSFRDAR